MEYNASRHVVEYNACRHVKATPRGRPAVVNIGDLRRMAQRRLPAAVFDYLDGGAEGEVTLRENCQAFEDVKFRPRHAVAVPHCDLRDAGFGG